MINLQVNHADACRLLSYVRERKRKAKRGLERHADNFDPELGRNMQSAYEAASALERNIEEKIRDYNNSRQSPAHRAKRERRA